MWIVQLAFAAALHLCDDVLLIVIRGGLAIVRTPTDIFPNIKHSGRQHHLEL